MKKKWILIAGIIIIIIVLIWLIASQKEKYFNKINIKDVTILNTIEKKTYLDTIIYSGLKSLEIKNIIVVIKPMTYKIKYNMDGMEIKANIRYQDNIYYIFIDNISRNESIKILSHELIHLKQYYTKELIYDDDNNKIFWKNEEFFLNNIEYMDRPWEKEAYSKQSKLETQMRNILY